MGHVKIVLREDVAHVGHAGDLVRVRAGYARNYLLPRGMASFASAGSVRQLEEQRKQAVARAAKLKGSAAALATKLGELTLTIARQAGEGNKLYGSVTSKDVAEEIAKKGFEVDKRQIVLEDALKDLGEHEVTVRVGHGVEAKLKVSLVRA